MTIERPTGGRESHHATPMDSSTDTELSEQVDELRPGMGGRWEVRTRSSTHIWDLDAMTYTRMPGEDSTAMPYDEEAMPLTRVEMWPAVGHRTLLFFDDPEDLTTEHWRICSRIRSISRLPSAAPSEEG